MSINDLTLGDTEAFYKKFQRTVQDAANDLMSCPPDQLAELVVMVRRKDDEKFTLAMAKDLTLIQAVQVLGGADPLESSN